MKFLLDTNIFLELILSQANESSVRKLLNKAQVAQMFVTDFSIHSIGVLLFRKKQHEKFSSFLDDMFSLGIHPIKLPDDELDVAVLIGKKFGLDFDDAYQYSVVETFDMTLVSFDADFDRTDRGKKTPQQILAKLK